MGTAFGQNIDPQALCKYHSRKRIRYQDSRSLYPRHKPTGFPRRTH
jgi:hypothetical protein